jgi:hypothetical protein
MRLNRPRKDNGHNAGVSGGGRGLHSVRIIIIFVMTREIPNRMFTYYVSKKNLESYLKRQC